MMVSFVLSFFPRDVLDEILNLIESVSEDFPSYFYRYIYSQKKDTQGIPPLKRRNGSGLTESGARFTELFKLKIFVGSLQFVWNLRNS